MSDTTRKSVQIMFSTQPDVKDMLDKQAKEAHLTRSAYITRLILQKEYENGKSKERED